MSPLEAPKSATSVGARVAPGRSTAASPSLDVDRRGRRDPTKDITALNRVRFG
jgi:hypothetical protein